MSGGRFGTPGAPGAPTPPWQPGFGPSGFPPGGPPPRRRRRRRRVIAATAAAAGVLAVSAAITGGTVALRHRGHEAAPDPATDPDAPVVALMETGDYITSPTRVFGTAAEQGPLFEGIRMAAYVAGPWQTDRQLIDQPAADMMSLLNTPHVLNTAEAVGKALQLDPEGQVALRDVVATHGFVTGFTTSRLGPVGGTDDRGAYDLTDIVLRFGADEQASAAAAELVAATEGIDERLALPAARELSLADEPDSIARGRQAAGRVQAYSYTPSGPYVFVQVTDAVRRPGPDPFSKAEDLLRTAMRDERAAIQPFKATDPADLADLPQDPSGQLLSRVLPAPDNNIAGMSAWVWQPNGWLHFEDDPVASATLFKDAEVEWVAQNLATVYQTSGADGAAKVVAALTLRAAADPHVESVSSPPGLPAASCFQRSEGAARPDEGMSIKRVHWRYRCFGQTDRYAFTAFSDTESDVKQQISAQYRLLAGV